MMKADGQIVLIDEDSRVLCGTDMVWEDDIQSASMSEGVLLVQTSNRGSLTYILTL